MTATPSQLGKVAGDMSCQVDGVNCASPAAYFDRACGRQADSTSICAARKVTRSSAQCPPAVISARKTASRAAVGIPSIYGTNPRASPSSQ